MRTILLLALAASAITGCDSAADKLFAAMSGREVNLVVLAKQPVTLSETPSTFASAEPIKVLGESTSLCLVLRDGVALQAQPQMDEIFSNALRGAKVKAAIVLSDGSKVVLNEPMQGWALSGRVLAKGELSACASASCGVSLPKGALVKSVELSAAPSVEVRGIFWQSEAGPNEKSQPAPSSQVAKGASGQSKCGAKA